MAEKVMQDLMNDRDVSPTKNFGALSEATTFSREDRNWRAERMYSGLQDARLENQPAPPCEVIQQDGYLLPSSRRTLLLTLACPLTLADTVDNAFVDKLLYMPDYKYKLNFRIISEHLPSLQQHTKNK